MENFLNTEQDLPATGDKIILAQRRDGKVYISAQDAQRMAAARKNTPLSKRTAKELISDEIFLIRLNKQTNQWERIPLRFDGETPNVKPELKIQELKIQELCFYHPTSDVKFGNFTDLLNWAEEYLKKEPAATLRQPKSRDFGHKREEMNLILATVAKNHQLPLINDRRDWVKEKIIELPNNTHITLGQKQVVGGDKGVMGGPTYYFVNSFEIRNGIKTAVEKIPFKDLENRLEIYISQLLEQYQSEEEFKRSNPSEPSASPTATKKSAAKKKEALAKGATLPLSYLNIVHDFSQLCKECGIDAKLWSDKGSWDEAEFVGFDIEDGTDILVLGELVKERLSPLYLELHDTLHDDYESAFPFIEQTLDDSSCRIHYSIELSQRKGRFYEDYGQFIEFFSDFAKEYYKPLDIKPFYSYTLDRKIYRKWAWNGEKYIEEAIDPKAKAFSKKNLKAAKTEPTKEASEKPISLISTTPNEMLAEWRAQLLPSITKIPKNLPPSFEHPLIRHVQSIPMWISRVSLYDFGRQTAADLSRVVDSITSYKPSILQTEGIPEGIAAIREMVAKMKEPPFNALVNNPINTSEDAQYIMLEIAKFISDLEHRMVSTYGKARDGVGSENIPRWEALAQSLLEFANEGRCLSPMQIAQARSMSISEFADLMRDLIDHVDTFASELWIGVSPFLMTELRQLLEDWQTLSPEMTKSFQHSSQDRIIRLGILAFVQRYFDESLDKSLSEKEKK